MMHAHTWRDRAACLGLDADRVADRIAADGRATGDAELSTWRDRDVMAMHTPEPRELKTIDGFDSIDFCRECQLEWGDDGCPTATTIKEALER